MLRADHLAHEDYQDGPTERDQSQPARRQPDTERNRDEEPGVVAGKRSQVIGFDVAIYQSAIILLAGFIQRHTHRHALHLDELISFETIDFARLNLWPWQKDGVRKHFGGSDHTDRSD